MHCRSAKRSFFFGVIFATLIASVLLNVVAWNGTLTLPGCAPTDFITTLQNANKFNN